MQLIELKAESFKRLKAVRIRPTNAVTPIVGRNGAGKTSVLDAIAAALGGQSQCPEQPIRKGEESAQVIVDLGEIKVRRRWTEKGSSLEVFSAEGAKFGSPQAMLDKLMGDLSFDPLAFTRMKPEAQAATLAKIAGLDLAAHSNKRRAIFDERTNVNRDLKAVRAQLDAMPAVEAPAEEISLADVLNEIAAAEAANKAADDLARAAKDADAEVGRIAAAFNAATLKPNEIELEYDSKIKDLEDQIAVIKAKKLELLRIATDDIQALKERGLDASKAADDAEARTNAAQRIDTIPLRQKATDAESINAKVRAAKARGAKAAEVQSTEKKSEQLTAQIEAVDAARDAAIAAAKLPVPNLTLGESGVLLNGLPFEQASGAEQLRVSVAIGLALNPQLKLMLIRDGSLLDDDSMTLLAGVAEAAGAQVLIERVDTGAEIGVRIVDGEVEGQSAETPSEKPTKNGRKPVPA